METNSSNNGNRVENPVTPAYVDTVSKSKDTDEVAVDKVTQGLKIWQVAVVLVLSLLLISWLKHDRLSSYWQQTYQQTKVWSELNQLPYWHTGLLPEQHMNTSLLIDTLSLFNNNSNERLNEFFYADILAHRRQIAIEKEQRLAALQEQRLLAELKALEEARKPKVLTEVQLSADQKVFFVGDSMMEGVAPWAMRELQSRYQIASINLSKRSTGLSYSNFFDWPATVEKTIADNPDIGVLVVLLGANDPWAVPDPERPGATYIKFGSPKWNELYGQKIQRILQAADEQQIQVMWLTPPSMKDEKLKENMAVLTELYHQVIPNTKALILDTKPILLDDADTNIYSDSMTLDGKKVKVRTADGIHFTTAGQKRLADVIVSHIKVL